MERFIHRVLVAYIILSPLVISSFAFGFYYRGVLLGQVRSELAWANLNAKVEEAFRQ